MTRPWIDPMAKLTGKQARVARSERAEKLMMDQMHTGDVPLRKVDAPVKAKKPAPKIVRAAERTIEQLPTAIRKSILRKSMRRAAGRYPW